MLEVPDAMRLGKRVKAWAIMRDIPLGHVAESMKVTRWHLSRTFSGEVPMSVELARDLCALTGLDIDGDDVHGPARDRS
jgi:hypothetical protein